jgi:hypothetical protein
MQALEIDFDKENEGYPIRATQKGSTNIETNPTLYFI